MIEGLAILQFSVTVQRWYSFTHHPERSEGSQPISTLKLRPYPRIAEILHLRFRVISTFHVILRCSRKISAFTNNYNLYLPSNRRDSSLHSKRLQLQVILNKLKDPSLCLHSRRYHLPLRRDYSSASWRTQNDRTFPVILSPPTGHHIPYPTSHIPKLRHVTHTTCKYATSRYNHPSHQ